jgi:hypothetical protein
MIEDLREELTTDPESLGYAALDDAGDHAGVTTLINRVDANRVTVVSTFATVRTLIAKIGPAGAVMVKKLRAFAAAAEPTDPSAFALQATVQEILPFISQGDPARGDGVDLGDPASRGLFGALVVAQIITQEEADAVLAIGTAPCSRAFELFGRDVTLNEVSEALNHGG